MIRSVCVFCGSSPGTSPRYLESAKACGKALAQRDWLLVYGGGRTGLMGAVADATLEAEGKVIGVIPDFLNSREIAHHGVTQLEVVQTMHQRKARMEELADAFIALPGGFGTFEELLEMITWAQLGLHRKPLGAFDIDGYYQPLKAQIDRAIDDGFITPNFQDLLILDDSIDGLLDKIGSSQPPQFERFLDRKWT